MDPVKRHYGVYRGVVKDNKDPQKQRRLKISVPQTTGTEVTEWAWPVEPSSIHTDLPVVGQGVWISYIGGDPDYPIWMGAFGKNQGKNKQIFIKPLSNTVSLNGLTSTYIKTNAMSDGTTELDLIDTIMLMANKLKNHETRIASLESQLTTLHSTLATRTAPMHTHGSNG
jgi:Type VI secretion system/phage-baseplate injector OB domain